ncbi:hypothetical protein GPZ88_10200 (plasmid) [Streptococcus ruminicola]|uniref:Uncharacterized protein n=1 Tax=Streptococcus ruminicola TaxID=2686210 RepID=A0A6G8I2S3_9STRE|nr:MULTISPECIES: hypothetical protein [Streptococcus]QGX47389.1 hypothetical protein GPA00_09655 [Streptococcus equinus]QIM47437.1 hypothetical protein GPZ88_10200 [Streptococcus ruminicola]
MESVIITKFEAKIGEVIFQQENLFYSVQYIVNAIEDKFGDCFQESFVEALRDEIETIYLKYDNFSWSVLENSFYLAIEEAPTFNAIVFNYNGCDWKLEWLNEEIRTGAYNI